MSTICFAHANGFPAEVYSTFLNYLKPYDCRYISCIGHTEAFMKRPNWRTLFSEWLRFIDAQPRPIIALGHSMGAVLHLQAYLWRPQVFQQLILMDPPLFHISKHMLLVLARKLGFADRLITPARQAKTRRTHWASRQKSL